MKKSKQNRKRQVELFKHSQIRSASFRDYFALSAFWKKLITVYVKMKISNNQLPHL